MKNAIVYYSFTNNNAALAVYLSKRIGCERFRIETIRQRTGFSIFLDILFHRKPAIRRVSVCLADYDHVIFIAPTWGGRLASPLVSFMAREKEMINEYSFISLCGGVKGQIDKVESELVAVMGKKPQTHMQLSTNDLSVAAPGDKRMKTLAPADDYQMLHVFDQQLDKFVRSFDLAGAI